MPRMFQPGSHSEGESAYDPAVPPPGIHVARLEAFERRQGKDSGEDYLSWKLRVVAGEYKGAPFYHMTSLAEGALWRFDQFVQAAGVEAPFDMDSDSAVKEALVGRVLQVKTHWEVYNGENRTRVQNVYLAEPTEDQAEFSDDDVPF